MVFFWFWILYVRKILESVIGNQVILVVDSYLKVIELIFKVLNV